MAAPNVPYCARHVASNNRATKQYMDRMSGVGRVSIDHLLGESAPTNLKVGATYQRGDGTLMRVHYVGPSGVRACQVII